MSRRATYSRTCAWCRTTAGSPAGPRRRSATTEWRWATGWRRLSPVHAIQHDLIDATQFFLHYRDHQDKIRRLAERIEPLFDAMVDAACGSPAPVVQWGSNYDEMLTCPPYFEQEIHAVDPQGCRAGWRQPASFCSAIPTAKMKA